MSRMCELRRTLWLYRRLHAELHASAIPDPRTRLQWTTRVALVLLHQTATQMSPCSARTANSSEAPLRAHLPRRVSPLFCECA